jgi:hypothetical protein
VKNGYNGPIYGTRPTFEIAALILKDRSTAGTPTRAREHAPDAAGLEPLEPLFEEQHVRGCGR